MSEDPEVCHVPRKKVPHKKVVKDYRKGMKYKNIMKKYHISRGGVTYSLEKMGVETNRIKSSARLKEGSYD